jgi:DNA-binding transcriptional LysR family regulator
MDNIDIRRLDFGLLLVFVALARHRKTTTAALRLGLTQSSVSHALSRLRNLFNDPLFERRPNGLEPTARALELEPEIQAILDRTSGLLAPPKGFDPKTAEAVMRIGAFDYDCALFAGDIVAEMRSTAPGIRTSFRPLVRRQALDALGSGELDLAIGYFWSERPGLMFEELFTESYAIILRRGHPLAEAKILDLDGYVAASHVLVSYEGDAFGIVDRTLHALALKREVAATVPFFFPALTIVAGSDLIATVPRRLASRYASAFALEVRDPPVAIRPFAVSAAWPERTRPNPMRAWFMEALRDIARRGQSADAQRA